MSQAEHSRRAARSTKDLDQQDPGVDNRAEDQEDDAGGDPIEAAGDGEQLGQRADREQDRAVEADRLPKIETSSGTSSIASDSIPRSGSPSYLMIRSTLIETATKSSPASAAEAPATATKRSVHSPGA